MSRDEAFKAHQARQLAHWNRVAVKRRGSLTSLYQEHLHRRYHFNIPTDLSVFEIGCGVGDLLAAVQPRYGLGVDLSPEMIHVASKKYPHLQFNVADAHDYVEEGLFDVIILSDLIGQLFDVQQVFNRIRSNCKPKGRIIINLGLD